MKKDSSSRLFSHLMLASAILWSFSCLKAGKLVQVEQNRNIDDSRPEDQYGHENSGNSQKDESTGAIPVDAPIIFSQKCLLQFAKIQEDNPFRDCAGCHAKENSEIPWLYGDSNVIMTNLAKYVVTNPSDSDLKSSYLMMKIRDVGTAHQGGKSFSVETSNSILTSIRRLDEGGCFADQSKNEGSSVDVPQNQNPQDPVSEINLIGPTLEAGTFHQLEFLIRSLAINEKGRAIEKLKKYKSQLGAPKYLSNVSSQFAITPITMTLLNEILAETCKEIALDPVNPNVALDYEIFVEDLVSTSLALTGEEKIEFIGAITKSKDHLVKLGASANAANIAACYLILKSERIWLR